MKLHYTKILLFSLLLNILAHNKNKSYITIHTPITTSRVLIECNVYIPNYDNDPDMNSVRENFHKKTEQRYHEYDKHMIKNRKKCKEQCDKDIQQIILKGKMQKSLEEKLEKACLKCGCGLGGVATSVGVLGTAVVNELKRTAMAVAIDAAWVEGATTGKAAGHAAGAVKVVNLIESQLSVHKIANNPLGSIINEANYTQVQYISDSVYFQYRMTCTSHGASLGGFYEPNNSMCTTLGKLGLREGTAQGYNITTPESLKTTIQGIVSEAKGVEAGVTKTATGEATAVLMTKKTGEVNVTYASCHTAIIASVVAILVIVLIMVIIYLILRYRRKKKMNKKLQYTKLLKE
ncbi:PIR protein, putative [Plasmodium sp.]|nr:PIR protein, putative [Plasmodium sp.]